MVLVLGVGLIRTYGGSTGFDGAFCAAFVVGSDVDGHFEVCLAWFGCGVVWLVLWGCCGC